MSRVSYSDGEDYPGQFGIWNANVNRSLLGRRGQVALRDLEAALLALPRKRLVRHVVACDGDVCAVGAVLAVRRASEKGIDVGQAVRELETELGGADDQAYDETPQRGEAAGMPRLVAWKVVALNDLEIEGRYEWCEGPLPEQQRWDYEHYPFHRGVLAWREVTPEERYERVLAWVCSQLRSSADSGQVVDLGTGTSRG